MIGPARKRRVVRTASASALGVVLLVTACSAPEPDPPASSPPPSVASGPSSAVEGLGTSLDSVVVVAAGDIARRPADGEASAELIRSVRPDAVLPLGDNAYNEGSARDYTENYEPTWGAFKEITRPVPGNHEYRTSGASGYFDYFRDQIADLPYYAWDAGPWRMYALNCDIDCGRDSEQVAWLRRDLAEHPDVPALAYVHEPLFTCSTRHKPLRRLDDIWEALEEGGGQALVSAHNHSYERFARQSADGVATPDGLRQFVVGTAGPSQYELASTCENREAQDDQSSGVLQLTLRSDSWAWEFVSVDGEVLDSGEDVVR